MKTSSKLIQRNFLLNIAVIIMWLCYAAGGRAVASEILFQDDFNRPNSAAVGNGWGEDSFSPQLPDMVSIFDNRLRIVKTPPGANRDAVAYRPFTHTCGLVVSGNVEWINGTPYGAALIGLNGSASWVPDGFHVQLGPLEFNEYHSGIYFYNETFRLFVPFTYDLRVPYSFEWSIRGDCSSDLRLWPAYQSRPSVPTASSPPVTLYPDWEVRFDNVVISADVTQVQIDIKPGSLPNCFNLNGNGVIPVAILGSADFDVTDINTGSLSFAGLRVRVRANNDPSCAIEYSNNDQFLDMICHFEDDPANWKGGNDTAEVTGNLIDGTFFRGTDSICIVP